MSTIAENAWKSMTTEFRAQLAPPAECFESEPTPSAEQGTRGESRDSEVTVTETEKDTAVDNADECTNLHVPYRPFLVLNFDTTSIQRGGPKADPYSASPESLTRASATEGWRVARRPAACDDCRRSRVPCHHDVEWTPAGIVLPDGIDPVTTTVNVSPSAPSNVQSTSSAGQPGNRVNYRWINTSPTDSGPGYLIPHEFADEPIPWQYMADQLDGEDSGEQAMIIPGTPVEPRVVGDEGYTGPAQRNALDGDRLVQLSTSRSDSE